MNTEQNISRMSMGTWKLSTSGFKKTGRIHQHTASKFGGMYYAIPPAEGWKGGLPEHNGWKPGK